MIPRTLPNYKITGGPHVPCKGPKWKCMVTICMVTNRIAPLRGQVGAEKVSNDYGLSGSNLFFRC